MLKIAVFDGDRIKQFLNSEFTSIYAQRRKDHADGSNSKSENAEEKQTTMQNEKVKERLVFNTAFESSTTPQGDL